MRGKLLSAVSVSFFAALTGPTTLFLLGFFDGDPVFDYSSFFLIISIVTFITVGLPALFGFATLYFLLARSKTLWHELGSLVASVVVFFAVGFLAVLGVNFWHFCSDWSCLPVVVAVLISASTCGIIALGVTIRDIFRKKLHRAFLARSSDLQN